MAWRDRIREASFRGVQFFVDAVDSGPFGRELVIHTFPGRDDPYPQDIGRQKPEFNVDGYVLGKDYLSQRDRLLEACEKEGAGELVHPYYGSILVRCKTIHFRDTVREQSIGRFTIVFTRSKVNTIEPVEDIDTVENLLSKREQVLQALSTYFTSAYNIVSKPYVFVANANATVNQCLLQVESNRRTVGSVSDFVRTLKNTADKVMTLVYSPAELFESLSYLLTLGTTSGDDYFPASSSNSKNQFNELRTLFTFTQETTIEDNEPAEIIALTVQQLALTAAAGLLVEMEFESINEAYTYQDIILTKMDGLSSRGVDDIVYNNFQELRRAIVEDIELRSVNLARLINITLQGTMPAIILSNTLYGKLDQELNIVQRNFVDHPGFVPGGVPIEVLTYVET